MGKILTRSLFADMNIIFINTKGLGMKVTERGQITIPKAIRDRYGLRPDMEVELILTENGVLIKKRTQAEHPVDKVLGVLGRPSDTDRYIEEVRGR
jgi:AbrB family looped-hinge helix DNA binding protein